VCLGAQARAANRAAKRDYEYSLVRREADWMQQLALTKAEQVEYDIGLDNSQIYTFDKYAELQQEYNLAFGEAIQGDEANWKKFLQNSTASNMLASGQTGRSVARQSVLDFGDYVSKAGRANYMLTQNEYKMKQQAQQIFNAQKINEDNLFAKVMYEKQPDLEPPKPVYQSVGAAMFSDALGIATSIIPILPK